VSYLWFKDGFAMSWATNATLTLTNLAMEDAGEYTVVVSNSVQSVTSSPAVLVVNPAGISLGLYPGIKVDGVVGKTYGIQFTLDVSQTNSWTTLTNLVLTEPVQLWLDPTTDTTLPDNPKRFYRVVPVR
jgi:hypothetical protein